MASSISPKRFIPATVKVNNISVRREAVYKILLRDIYNVLSKVLKDWEVLTILKSLETLMILRAVILKLSDFNRFSSTAISDMITMMKSNLFQLTCQ